MGRIMPGRMIDSAAVRRSLGAAAGRSAGMIATLESDLPVGGSEWTVGETAAHLIITLRGFTGSVTGDDEGWRAWEARIPDVRTPQRLAVMNRLMIAAEPGRTPMVAARAITDAVEAFLTATAGLPPAQPVATPWYGLHRTLTVAEATSLLLGEQVVHGRDVAMTAHRKWPIDRRDALLVFDAVQELLPMMADPAAIGDVTAAFEVHLGRSARFVLRFADGAVTVEPGGQRVDCHVVADPVQMLLLGYGRTTQWRVIGRGKLFTWGRRPWLAFRLPGFFSHP